MVGPAWKVPSPLPSSTEMVLSLWLATTKSGLPSPLKSPTATKAGALPTRKLSGPWKVPSPLPRSTETLLEPMLATAKSSLPSRLKSPTARDQGLIPTGKVNGGWKVPSPLPSSTETVLELTLAAARSSLPSPLKSPTATDAGSYPPVGKSRSVTNDIVWAGAGLGSVVMKNKIAATQSSSLAEFLLMLSLPLSQGSFCIESPDEPSRSPLTLAAKSAVVNYVKT